MPSFPINNLVGARALGPVAIAQGLTNVTLSLDASTMTDSNLHVQLDLDLSLDNGVTWSSVNKGPVYMGYPLQMTLDGGAVDKHGAPLPAYIISADLPWPNLATRQIRGTVTVTGGSLSTTANLTVS